MWCLPYAARVAGQSLSCLTHPARILCSANMISSLLTKIVCSAPLDGQIGGTGWARVLFGGDVGS